ncbi:MAG: PspC domain-containing protein, partial [Bacteroidetes bacterium]|nr:PspC domain-containing protein [Bacteroidota bacterium]
MNKTLSIGLAGFSFVIEEHAYIKLSDYLTALRNSLDQEESEEVMHDIEIRMVELFRDSLGKREVINDNDVEKIISKIGTPEVIEEQEEAYVAKDKTKTSQRNFSTEKQLFRDPENAKIGGVCAGLAHYFGIDISWMRIIWALLIILGLSNKGISTMLIITIYVVLWIVLPQAKSASDFLKMKGKPLNFDNLKEESGKIVEFANESSQKIGDFINQNKPIINKTGSGIGRVIVVFLGAIFGLMGLSLLFSAIAILGTSIDNDFISLPGDLQFFLQDGFLKYFGIACAFLTVFIPSFIFLYISIRLISPKTKLNYTGYVLGGLVFLWIIFLGLFGYKALKYKTMYNGTNDEV